MHPNEQLLRDFYTAFQRRDAQTMGASYAQDATFRDPVFQDLRGAAIGRMWAMLCANARELDVQFFGVTADDNAGSVHWQATYLYGPQKRRVRNRVTANFAFAKGRITAHVDSFSFWRWAGQALGPAGWLAGWTPAVKRQVREEAARRLATYVPLRKT